MAFTPSVQQAVFLDWISNGKGSCVLEAVAGAGKTTTLIEAVARTGGGVAFLAYNKKIADEIKGKLLDRGIDWKTAEAGTIHSFGFRAYRKAFPEVKVDANKLADIIEANLGKNHAYAPALIKLVSLAKQRALGVLGSIEDHSAWYSIINHFDILGSDDDLSDEGLEKLVICAINLLHASNDQTDIVDFDDMVYLPLIKRVRFWRNRWVFVDEAQDTNPARRALVRALLAPGGRVVAVGDRHQAIYGFTGADSDSLDLIAQDFDCCRLPLTTTYRCPKAVVAFAQQWVSHIEAHESAPEGEVRSLDLSILLGERDNLNGSSAILCRNTKPLVALAFQLIRAKVACRVEGRDIGVGLIKLATKWKGVATLHGLEVRLEAWGEREVTKALAKKNETRAQSVQDQRETLQVIIDDCRAKGQDSVDAVVEAINSIFANDVTDMLVLSTIHKSKGREWNTVYWLDRAGTCPSKYARQAWQQEQEVNLMYVAATRAKRTLVDLIDSETETDPRGV